MTMTKIQEILNRNKQLEHENKILKERIISIVLSENIEVVQLNFKVNQLESRVKRLVEENVKLHLSL